MTLNKLIFFAPLRDTISNFQFQQNKFPISFPAKRHFQSISEMDTTIQSCYGMTSFAAIFN